MGYSSCRAWIETYRVLTISMYILNLCFLVTLENLNASETQGPVRFSQVRLFPQFMLMSLTPCHSYPLP